MILMKEHFYQAINETEHLKEMEKRGGDRFWIDRFFARHLVLVYYWIMVFYYFFLTVFENRFNCSIYKLNNIRKLKDIKSL